MSTKGELTIILLIVSSFVFDGRVILAQYFDNVDLKSEIKQITVKIFDTVLKLNTDNGVFSKEKLDFGTRVLVENLPLEEFHGRVLDIGCGYGPIGIYLKKNTDCDVDMTDVNKRALHLAKMNAKLNSADVSIFESDAYQNISEKYDYIVTNPPIRVGKQILYSIVMGAREHLVPGGSLFLVIHKDQGAKSMIIDLEKYYNVTILDKNKGFFVIRCDFR